MTKRARTQAVLASLFFASAAALATVAGFKFWDYQVEQSLMYALIAAMSSVAGFMTITWDDE